MNTIPPYWKPYLGQFHEMVGNPAQRQPADGLRVNKAESDQMVEALKKRGVDVEYMVKNNEGHEYI